MAELIDEGSSLIAALAQSQRFHLYIAHCASGRAADHWIAALSAELPKRRGRPVRIVRLAPYDAASADAPWTAERCDRVLAPLLDDPAAPRDHGTIHVVDASRAGAPDEAIWARLFARWNERRDLLQRFTGEVVVVLSARLAPVFATWAPDIWSLRCGEYRLAEPAVAGELSDALAHGLARGSGRSWPTPQSSAPAAQRDAPSASGSSPKMTLLGELASKPATVAYRGTASATRASPLERLAAWRMVPPLSLFGGALEIAPWLDTVLACRGSHDVTEPPGDPRHALRAAELALGERRFADARAALAQLGDIPGDAMTASRLAVAQALTLAASDAPGAAWFYAQSALEHASQLAPSAGAAVLSDVQGVAAFVHWCRGELARADSSGDVPDGDADADPPRAQQSLLLAMARGELGRATAIAARLAPRSPRWVSRRPSSGPADASRMVAANFAFLGTDLATARRDLRDATPELHGRGPADPTALLVGARPFAALLAAAHGDLDAAERALRTTATRAEPAGAPADVAARAAAFVAYATGVIASERAGTTAWGWFDAARQAIARWAEHAFDRRALGRAHAATLVCASAVDADPARAFASACEAQAVADRLVGAGGEDHVARVLAVVARRARRRLTSDPQIAHSLAREAVELLAPVHHAGAATWAALAAQCAADADDLRA